MLGHSMLLFAIAGVLVPSARAQEAAGTGAAPRKHDHERPAGGADSSSIRTANDGKVVLDGVPEIPARIAQRMNRYLNARWATLQDWTEDGQGVYILTRFGDVEQLHRVAMPGGDRQQLTFLPEPVNGAWRKPGGGELVYLTDVGGSEFYQLVLLDPGSGAERRLTDGRSRNTFGEWSRDGRRFAFTSTRRNGRSNDVWVAKVAASSAVVAPASGDSTPVTATPSADSTEAAPARLVLEAPDGALWEGVDWDDRGERLLVTQYVGITDSRLHLVDLATGKQRPIAGGPERPANYTGVAPAFSRDGEGVFLATDARGEFLQLGYLDLRSGKLEILTPDIAWDVEVLELSEDRTRAAFVVNEGGISRLYLMDPATRAYRKVDGVPMGVIPNMKFSPDGTRLAFTLDAPTGPGDVYSIDLRSPTEAGELVRWTRSEVGGLDRSRFVAPELVSYSTFDARPIPAFVYRPSGSGPHPVIVEIHGGPESQERPGFKPLLQFWVNELGAAVIEPNVRGSSGYGKAYVKLDDGERREDSVKDIGALLDWIAAQPDLDSSRIAVVGGSYGGYMVLATLVHYSDRIRAAVDLVGISNFVTFLENTQDYRRDLRRVEYGDERDPCMRAFLERVSPSRNADRIRAPLLVAQGANDPRVPVTEAEQIVRAVRANGRDVWYMNALNEGHGFQKKENRDLYRQIETLFFETHLLPAAGSR